MPRTKVIAKVQFPKGLAAQVPKKEFQAMVKLGMAALSLKFFADWRSLAAVRLKTSLESYLGVHGELGGGLGKQSVKGGYAYDFSLGGWLPTAVEFGHGPFDMKETMLYGIRGDIRGVRKACKKDGKPYFIVPFKFYKTEKAAESATRGVQYDKHAVRANNLLKEIENAGKKGDIGAKKSAGKRFETWAYGRKWKGEKVRGRMGGLIRKGPMAGKGFRYLPQAERKVVSHTGYISKVGKLMGIRRSGGSELQTFRTVSEKSAPRSWIHPGIRARMLHREMVRALPQMAEKVFKPLMQSLSGNI